MLPAIPLQLTSVYLKMSLALRFFSAVASWFSLATVVLAGFDPGLSKNLAIYWGEFVQRKH